MSWNRENIIWQSADGTWSRGFYDSYETGSYDDDDDDDDDEDYDPEWDVEYLDSFFWVSCGHRSMEDAERSWDGANPGSQSVLPYSHRSHDEVTGLDDEAALVFERGGQAYGVRKQRSAIAVARDLRQAELTAHTYGIHGYSNLPDERIPTLSSQLTTLMQSASDEDRRAVLAVEKEHADALRALVEEHRTALLERNRRTWSHRQPLPQEKYDAALAAADAADKRVWRRRATVTSTSKAPASRRKTTAASTPGSFAPKPNSAPDVTL